ncbi:MAG: glycosyltransferase [Victivallaceae bacterium]|nr:glycosyltransferase [Victivallaceae bacterium]
MKEITVIIPNYRTPQLARLCLRSLRKHTDPDRIRVLVIDNDSQDESVEYLRSVDWIDLVERKTGSEDGPAMHVAALNEALAMVDTDLVLVMHTDTIVIHDQWLDFLLSKLGDDPMTAGVGSWKLETVTPLKIFGKRIENTVRRLLGKKVRDPGRYFRSHCALYRTGMVKAESCGFGHGTAGEAIFAALQKHGYKLPFIASEELSKYIRHLNHATMILNPREGDRKTGSPSARRKLERELASLGCDRIMADASLDRL